jgi:hypothetical protein
MADHSGLEKVISYKQTGTEQMPTEPIHSGGKT